MLAIILRLEAAEVALADAIDGMEDMIAYVPDYFREKWGHDAYLARAKAAEGTYRPKGFEDHPSVRSGLADAVRKVGEEMTGANFLANSVCFWLSVMDDHGNDQEALTHLGVALKAWQEEVRWGDE